MKKTLIGLLAMSVLLTTSCLKESVLSQGAGDEVAVSFTTSLRETPKTKALGNDAGSVDKLEVAVYKETEGEVELVMTKTVTEFNDGAEGTKSAEVTVTLIKGQTYRVAFWAQDADYTAYEFNAETSEVSINYENVKANTASADAFFASTEVEVTGSFSKAVTLSRPFAQINFLTSASDLEAAAAVGVNPVNSSVTASGVASTFNVLTGVAEDVVTGDVTYQTQPIHKVTVEGNQVFESAIIAAKDAQYYYLATAYVLVPTAEEGATEEPTVAATMTVDNCEPVNVGPLTVKRNYRTNVYGDFLTSQGVFTVQVNPGFAGSNIEKEHVEIADGVMILETEVIEETGEVVPTTFGLSNANGLKWFAERVNAVQTKATSSASDLNVENKTIVLLNNIDLTGVTTNGDSFGPIGRYCSGKGENDPWTGHFDGNGYTIKGINQSGWDFGYEWGTTGYLGLFGYVVDATIENLTIEGMEAVVEGGTLGAVAGRADGSCVFKNITIKNTKLGTYNNRCGGIVGWTGYYKKINENGEEESVCDFTFENINICDDVVLGGLWGSFDSSIGGIMGQLNSGAAGKTTLKNVTVSCRIDAYNDCTASYDYYNYRMCGMLIGQMTKTTQIDGSTYPDVAAYEIDFNNVVVKYGDWMYYHYCEPTPGLNGGRGMRVEPGFAYDGLPSDFDHTQCVDNHYNCIPFDQLFGGTQTACKGVKAWEGITVIYPEAHDCNCGEDQSAGGDATTGEENTETQE